MLPSQSTRSRDSRRHTYRRRRSRLPRLALLLVLVVVAVVVVWRIAAGGGDDAPPPAASALGAEPVAETDADREDAESPAPAPIGQRPEAPIRTPDRPGDEAGPRAAATPPAAMPEIRMAEPVPAELDAGTDDGDDDDTSMIAAREETPAPRIVDAAPPPARRTPPPPVSRGTAEVLADAEALPLPEQRRRLHAALARTADDAEAAALRARLAEINDRLVFSPEVVPEDPFAFTYTIASGDSLARIVDRLGLQIDWRFLKRINRIPNENLIRAGQRIKVVTGPFHAVIDKSDYRLDLYLGEGRDQVYVRSFPVGTGKFNATPTGLFRVRADSKLVDPAWVNPRTRERYAADDPANPIGERWIGLEGVDETNRDVTGYGIHGTIEPESIGTQASMGCVRMLDDDVKVVYELLMERVSGVVIRE